MTPLEIQLKANSICYPTYAEPSNNKKGKQKMTSIIPRLNRTHKGSDGRYPLIIQVIRHRQKREIDTPYRLYAEEFNNQSCLAVHVYREAPRAGLIAEVNRYLGEKLMELNILYSHVLALKGEGCTAADIADTFRHRADMTRFFVYADSQINELRCQGREGTANNYLNACRSFAIFLGGRMLSFDQFTTGLIDAYADYLKARDCQCGTMVFYLRQLRAIYNKAVKARVVQQDMDPFRNQTLTEPRTRKRALTRENIRRVHKADPKGAHKDVFLARDLFIFSFYTCGMPFVDMCHLTRDNIEGKYICYKRRKTSRALRIRIEKPLRELLVRYADPASPYLLPMLRKGDEYKDYRNAGNRLGKRIRELGNRLQLEEPLTFYVARHTWATLARDSGVELSVISACMGHTSEKTTRIYLAEMDYRRIDNANCKVAKVLK